MAAVISACTSRFSNRVEPLVWSGDALRRGVFLFDGSSCWGSGADAASWLREELAALFASRTELGPTLISDSLASLVGHLPSAISSEEFGWSFSMAVALVEAATVHLGLVGSFSAVLLRGSSVRRLFTPPRLVDELVALGHIRSGEAEQHQYRRVFLGPFFGISNTSLTWLEPLPIAPADTLLLGDAALPHLLEARLLVPGSDAHALRDDIERLGGHNCPAAILDLAGQTGPCPG